LFAFTPALQLIVFVRLHAGAAAEAHTLVFVKLRLTHRRTGQAVGSVLVFVQLNKYTVARSGAKLTTPAPPRAELQHEMAANVQALVARLRGPDAGDQASAAAALAEQARTDASLGAVIAAAGALPLLIALLRSGTADGKASAAAAIAELAQHVPTRTLIVEGGALPPLVALLRSGTERGKRRAASALTRLAQHAPARRLIVGAGALPPLVALLRPGSERAKANAAYVLALLAQDAPTRTLIVGE
jgi:hypothetical protein